MKQSLFVTLIIILAFLIIKKTKFFWIIFFPLITYIIKSRKFNNLEDMISFSHKFWFGLIRPMQIKEEILELLKFLQKKDIKVIIEIGTARGGTLFLFSRIASKDALLISIDLPKGDFGGGYSIFRIPLYKSFKTDNQNIFLIRSDSHKIETLNEIKKILGDKKADILYIDGDHTYEGVKKDFEMYRNLVNKDGFIIFHDIFSHTFDSKVEVFKLWNEIKSKFDAIEICSQKKVSYGIGIIKNENST